MFTLIFQNIFKRQLALLAICLFLPFYCLSCLKTNQISDSTKMLPADSFSCEQERFNSKLSLHTSFYPSVIEKDIRYSMAFVASAKPPLLKILGGLQSSGDTTFSWAEKVKQASPCTKIIGRIFIPNKETSNSRDGGDPIITLHPANILFYPPTDAPNRTPEEQARIWFNAVKETIKKYPAVDYWEGLNEPMFSKDKAVSLQEMTWYNRFESKRTKLLESLKTKACIGNFSMGTPHIDDQGDLAAWEAFYPALMQAQKSKGLLCLHEYGYPHMDTSFDEGSHEGWLVGRYRKVMRHLEARHAGLFSGANALNLAFTEAGIDGGRDKGWKSLMSSCEYLKELMWYDALLKSDNNVLGATLFQFEIFPDSAWSTFNLRDVLNGINALHHGINPLLPETHYCKD